MCRGRFGGKTLVELLETVLQLAQVVGRNAGVAAEYAYGFEGVAEEVVDELLCVCHTVL